MKLTNEQIEQILECVPDGEPHVHMPIAGGVMHEVHRIDDLREIQELRREVERLEVERDEWRKNAAQLANHKEGTKKGDAAFEIHYKLMIKYPKRAKGQSDE